MNTYRPEATNPAGSSADKGGLFRTADGKSLAVTFVLITSLFLLWGFCNGMIDILNKHFQDTLRITKEQSGLVQSANYLAYFLMAIPAGLMAKKIGYKGGILVGLSLIAGGAFWFIRATEIGTYWPFLLGLFVIAAGMTCLETIANPYATVLGAPEGGPTRINIAQTTNGFGSILGPTVGGYFVFSGADGASANSGLSIPYMGIGVFVVLLLIVFAVSRVPDLHAEDENLRSATAKIHLKPSGAQTATIAVVVAMVCGVLYFFIAPILGLFWTLLHMSEGSFQWTKYGLLIVAYGAAFFFVSRNWEMFRRKHFTLGIAAQFFYVAAQTGIFSFCVNYILENDPGVTTITGLKLAGPGGFRIVHRRTPLRQRCDQPVQAGTRPGRLLGYQCGSGRGRHGRRQSRTVCDVRHVLLHVGGISHDFRAGYSRVGRVHQAGLIAHRHVHRRRGHCRAFHGSHCRLVFDAYGFCRAAGLLCVHRAVRAGMAVR